MPSVARALIPMEDASAAIQRGLDAWNPSQLQDAIQSAEYFIGLAKKSLHENDQPEFKAGVIYERR
jgi:hypothetical protein